MNRETILQNKIIVALCERGCYAVNHTVGDFFVKKTEHLFSDNF